MSIYSPEGAPPVIPNAMARIERRLPHPGEVIARVGGRVEPEDIVATTFKPEPPLVINVARQLAIPPFLVERAMRIEAGNKVMQGQSLARAGRFSGRFCTAPVSGMITAIDSETGYVTIAPDPQQYQLQASVRGVVMEVLPHSGVIIETPAAQVYGVAGMGEERSGVLRLLVTDPNELITAEQIDARSAYTILIGGAGISAAALRRAVQEQVRGIIVGGIEEPELRAFLGWAGVGDWQCGMHTWHFPDQRKLAGLKLTIILTEGFGTRPMAAPIFDLLSSHDRQEALIEGDTSLRQPLRRPRLVIPRTRSAGAQVEPPRPSLRPGALVRLLNHDQLGQLARVRMVAMNPRRLDSGLRMSAVEVELPDEQLRWLPRTAVEVLE